MKGKPVRFEVWPYALVIGGLAYIFFVADNGSGNKRKDIANVK